MDSTANIRCEWPWMACSSILLPRFKLRQRTPMLRLDPAGPTFRFPERTFTLRGRPRATRAAVFQIPVWRNSLLFRRTSAVLVLSLASVHAWGKTIHVDPTGPADFHSVQRAVDAAASGDVITVSPGIYREVVVIAKPNLTLRGEGSGPQQTVIVFDK